MGHTIAGTGHRPEKIREPEDELRSRIAHALRDGECSTFICGMASGFDLIAGTTALRIGIPVIAAKPWAGHGPRVADRNLYKEVIESGHKIVEVSSSLEYEGPWVYHQRNEWMVDNADRVLAYYNGDGKGGTAACVRYANKVGKPVRNIYV